MYGALNLQSITLLNTHLLAAFGSHYYLFSTDSQLCLAQFNIGHQSSIICSSIVEEKQKYSIRSLDQAGICIQASLFFQRNLENSGQKNFTIKAQAKQSILSKKQNSKIIQASFITHDCIFFLKENKKLQSFSVVNSSLSHISHQLSFSKIINKKNEPYAYLVQQHNHKISIYNKQNLSILKQYNHTTKITSATSVQQILIIGDIRGKITLLYEYLSITKSKKAQFSSILQWHTSPVNSLCSNGQYIYSAGQESVVVLWHTRDLSRDFLPRIGTSIEYLNVKPQSNQIICGLSDNSIKIIDLSQDKQTSTYKTILDPKGYASQSNWRFSSKLTSFHHGMLCLNSLPGKLQFISFEKNGENNQLQIVPRNIVNSINQDKIQPHRINSFVFSQDWTSLLVSVLSHHNQSYLKFYRRGAQGYQLVNKTQNPHVGQTKSCLFIGFKKNPRFITYSQNDNGVKIWSQHKQKKKSIIDSSQVYWKCISQLKHRNMKITSVNTFNNLITVLFEQSQIIVYQIDQDGSINIIQNLTGHHNIFEVYIIDCQIIKGKKKIIKFLITKNNGEIQIWNYQQNKIQISAKLKPKQKIQVFLCNGIKDIALFLNTQQSTKLIIINKKSSKFTQSYDSDVKIQSGFWMQDRLMLVGADLTISAIDGKPIIKYAQIQSGDQIVQDQEIDTILTTQADIFKINKRWIQRQSIKNKKKAQDCVESFEILPSCSSVWEQMSTQLLL